MLNYAGENPFDSGRYEAFIILQMPVFDGNFFDNWLDCLTAANFKLILQLGFGQQCSLRAQACAVQLPGGQHVQDIARHSTGSGEWQAK